MSREAYQIPSSLGGGAATPGYGGSSGGAAGAGAGAGARAIGSEEGVPMNYICGDCGTKFPLKRNEAIRCRECGCRVLYKVRTNRMVQFEAR